MFIDTHAHFEMCLEERKATEEDMLSSLKENNVTYAVQISTEVKTFDWSYKFSKRNKNIFFTIGIHPSSRATENDLISMSNFTQKVIEANDRDRLFGIGEIGLDYYRMRQPKDNQIRSFEYQLEIAKKFDLPVIIHSRDAKDETLKILKSKQPKKGLMHCFSGNGKAAKEVLDLGFFISFAGNLTYNKATDLHDAAKFVPLDRVMLETDAPFLTPVPLRGQKNVPEYVTHTYRFFAGLKNESINKIEDDIYNNFLNFVKVNP